MDELARDWLAEVIFRWFVNGPRVLLGALFTR